MASSCVVGRPDDHQWLRSLDEAAQKLRDTQEVLAEGNLRVANHYMILKRYEASKNRTIQVIEKYPDFSRQDEALWVLGQALEKQKLVPQALFARCRD